MMPAAFYMPLGAACCSFVMASIMESYGDMFACYVFAVLTIVCLGLLFISRQERP